MRYNIAYLKKWEVFAVKRNHGIDLLRMVSMLMVVILHILVHGGVLVATSQLTAKYSVSWLMESLAFCAVNCYALITGYVHFSSRYRFASLAQICLQALLYSLGIAVCVWILKPESFSVESLIHFLFPVSKNGYWYLSAYVGLFVLIPFLNAGVNALSEKQTKTFLGLLFFVFSIIPILARQDTFSLNYGYSAFWLAMLYIGGASIRKYGWGDALTSRKALLIYICGALAAWGLKLGWESATRWLLGEAKTGLNFFTYPSPTMVIAAVGLFFAFKNAAISPRLAKFIAEFSPAALGVYLIHEHDYVKAYFISDRFAGLTEFSPPVMAAGILGSALAIFTVCILIDWIRHKIFRRMRVKETLEKLEEKYIRHNITAIK